ncbi:MAG: formylglycine-generating enzyme family protein [Nitrospirota bacterium]|nr:formylglycine-generating enzyme family protein [Nitrospirota bacterium]
MIRKISSLLSLFLFIAAMVCAADNPTPPEGMVYIPGGEFTMGTDEKELEAVLKGTRGRAVWFRDETPSRKVAVKPFFIDIHEVTNAEYKRFRSDHTYPSGRENHPVVNVTWNDADAYAKWAGKRLPTEEEWEKAARGADGRIYPWGNVFGKDLANTSESGLGGRAKVGQYKVEQSGEKQPAGTTEVGAFPGGKSTYGIHDMAGNAWEWTDSWYDKGRMLRVLRGGSWLAPAVSARAAVRLGDAPGEVANDYGFRCAKDAE